MKSIYRALSGGAWLFVAVACGSGGDDRSAGEHEHEPAAARSEAASPDTVASLTRQAVHLSEGQERALGIVYTEVGRQALTRSIRTVGRIEAAEPNVAEVVLKIEGFVEELYVSTTGETVRQGQPLLTLYSPALVAAQEELLTAKRLAAGIDASAAEAWASARAILEAARRRLSYWDITAEQIARIETTGEVTKTLTLVSPVPGIVLEKAVLAGQQVRPGMRLYRIADLSEVWIEGDVFEQDLQFVHEGAQAHIEVAAYPGEHSMGLVSFVYPTVDERSRTGRVRLLVPNEDLRLKPGMYATVYFDAEIGSVLALPLDAVVATGERNLVFVRDEDGMLQPREVVLGARAGDQIQVLSGLVEGEVVVSSANFLVDAESRLASTGGAMPGHAGHGAAVDTAEPGPEPERQEHDHD